MKNKDFTISQIRASYPLNKREPLWTCWVLRPLSFPVAKIFVNYGFTGNQVSILAIVITLIAAFLTISQIKAVAILGAILFNLYSLLDCVDGHVARVRGHASEYGGWMDALGGYVAYTCVLLSGGIASELYTNEAFGFINNLNFIILGALAASANLLMRLEYQHLRCIRGEETKQSINLQKKLGANLGITGFLMPLFLWGLIFEKLHLVILFYFMFYVSACIVMTIKFMINVLKMQEDFLRGRED